MTYRYHTMIIGRCVKKEVSQVDGICYIDNKGRPYAPCPDQEVLYIRCFPTQDVG